MEWIIGGISTCLILAMLAFLTKWAIESKEIPPLLELNLKKVISWEKGHLVVVEVNNKGTKTAKGFMFEGTLTDAEGKKIETSSAVIQFVPAKARREAGLIFKAYSKDYKLEFNAKGFENP